MNTPDSPDSDSRSTAESFLAARFGPHCGLNADWGFCAWRVSGRLYAGIFIVDEEDGTFSLVRSSLDSDGMHATETLLSRDAKDIAQLVQFATTPVTKAAEVCLELSLRHDIEASVEVPEHVCVPLSGDRSLAIGTVNLDWGCDLCHPDGAVENLWNLPLRTDAETLADAIAKTFQANCTADPA